MTGILNATIFIEEFEREKRATDRESHRFDL